MNSMYDIWKKADEYIKEELSPMVYADDVSEIKPVALSNNTLILKVDATANATASSTATTLFLTKPCSSAITAKT